MSRPKLAPVPEPPNELGAPTASVLLAIRLTPSVVADLDELASRISMPGFQASRTDAHRCAVLAGLQALRNSRNPWPDTLKAREGKPRPAPRAPDRKPRGKR